MAIFCLFHQYYIDGRIGIGGKKRSASDRSSVMASDRGVGRSDQLLIMSGQVWRTW